MQIDIRLKKMLKQHGLDRHGVIHEISSDLGVHRHSVANLYNNKASHPSLELLGRICDWVASHAQDIQPNELIRDLLGNRPSELWQAITRAQNVSIYLGERQHRQGTAPLQRWISRRDAAVATDIIQYLSTAGVVDGPMPRVLTQYVPVRFTPGSTQTRRRFLQEDADRARTVLDQMRQREPQCSAILIGSQRVNPLTEHLVAQMFGCEPFRTPKHPGKVPFYLQYRDKRALPSCFGQPAGASAAGRSAGPGIYYLDEQGKWVACPWDEHREDSGIVIVAYDPSSEATELTLFGFSGLATVIVGRRLLQSGDRFWPPPAVWRGRQIGVYVCRFSWPHGAVSDDANMPAVSEFVVIPMAKSVLEHALQRPRHGSPHDEQ